MGDKEDKCPKRNILNPNICSPITCLAQVKTCLQQPPEWTNQIISLTQRSQSVVKNPSCHVTELIPTVRFNSKSVPRTLVCHDMKGGYLEDKYIGPINIGNGYTFYRWAHIDTFVYFSHHLITIPPLSWINVAHLNGVKILGTFITEWVQGEAICDEIFKDLASTYAFVSQLVDICLLFKLDGWLLNIENPIKNVRMLKLFVKQLSEEMHHRKPGSLVVWYDSVTSEGLLSWQNELNVQNRCYFDSCDGIFLNYTWKEENLLRSVEAAGHRALDVYVGVDVFGRNSFGGGNFNTHLAAEKIREHNLSMAIFAQGWTYETLPPKPATTILERFHNRDNVFWRSLWPYLYTHPIATVFQTFFYTGVDKEWFNLNEQQVQLTKFLHSKTVESEEMQVPTLKDSCDCLQLHMHDKYTSCLITKKNLDAACVHHLFSCDIQVNNKIVVYNYTKGPGDLSLVLLVQELNGVFKKVTCHSGEAVNQTNASIIEVEATELEDILNLVAQEAKNIPANWILRCYLVDLFDCRILEIGAKVENSMQACLCGIGIRDATIL